MNLPKRPEYSIPQRPVIPPRPQEAPSAHVPTPVPATQSLGHIIKELEEAENTVASVPADLPLEISPPAVRLSLDTSEEFVTPGNDTIPSMESTEASESLAYDPMHSSTDIFIEDSSVEDEKENETDTMEDPYSAISQYWSSPDQEIPAINPEEEFDPIDPDFAPRDEPIEAKIQFIESSNELSIDDLLIHMIDMGGSDLHLSAGTFPMIRHHGEMVPIPNYNKLSGEEIEQMINSIMTIAQRNIFEENWELDFAYSLVGKSRFRVNVMRQSRNVSVVMRTIPWEIKTVEELGLPPVMRTWASIPRGLVLVTGPTGSGKSTSLAAIIDHANRTRKGHIITIEDPIEFVHAHKMSVVNQREVGTDTKSFAEALKHVLRQDPDIILVGELRDLETISVALTAAETGHAVFATLHTQSAAETISRLVDVFPEGAQQQVRTQIAATIQGIACQTLLKTYDGKGRIAATEILVANPAIRNLIREGKLEQIQSSLQTSESEGMQTLDSVLEKLVREGKVHYQTALDKAANRKALEASLGGVEALEKLDRQIRNRHEGIVF